MDYLFLKFIIMIIFCEALVELICKAEILEKPRNWFKSLSTFTNRLISCYYCTSVWCGLFSIILMLYIEKNIFVFLFVFAIVIHRLSNFLHLIFSILRDYQVGKRFERYKNSKNNNNDLL